MSNTVKKSQLETLRNLVNSLSDRDLKIKRDIRLFEEFFQNFPIPVTIWSLTSEGSIISKRGNGLIRENAQCLQTLFEEFDTQDSCIEAHTNALKGIPSQDLVLCKKKMYYMSLAPRRDEEGKVSGVLGLAWDVTTNYNILLTLEEIIEVDDPKFEAISNKAKNALNESRLYRLLIETEVV